MPSGALTDAREDRDTTEVLGDAIDHLLDEHGLTDTGAANRPILPPSTYGVSRSMTLMPVSNISVFDSSSSYRRRAVDRPALGDVEAALLDVERLAEDVEDWPW